MNFFSIWTCAFAKYRPKWIKWRFFQFSGKLPLPETSSKMYSKLTLIWTFCVEKFFQNNLKSSHFFHYLKYSEVFFIWAYNWTYFQQNMGIQAPDFEQKFPIFKHVIGFFSNSLKKSHDTRKVSNFIQGAMSKVLPARSQYVKKMLGFPVLRKFSTNIFLQERLRKKKTTTKLILR